MSSQKTALSLGMVISLSDMVRISHKEFIYSDCHKHVPIEQSATNEQTIALLQGFTRLSVVRFAGKT